MSTQRTVAWQPLNKQLMTTTPPIRLIVAETPDERDEMQRLFAGLGCEVIPLETITVTEWLRESGALRYANGNPLPAATDDRSSPTAKP